MMGGWGFGGMMIFNLIFGILIIVGLIYLVRYLIRGGHSQISAEDSALNILKERYAKGEIDKKEFEEKMKDLK
ncbi:SHOCT domain-containing protein [Patescibacteria group bacterium]|nr:SHOCT domain-containing protein [Patescibacteria group bacterium]